MSLSLRLDLRQSQALVMTPQLQQAIKLLQLPNLELAAYVATELEQNPFLESAEAAADEFGPGDEDAPDADTRSAELTGSLEMDFGEAPGGGAESAEDGWADPQRDDLPRGLEVGSLAQTGRGGGLDFFEPRADFEARLSQPKSLRDHLIEQLQLDLPPGPERLIGLHLIDLVDEAGYLRDALSEVAERLGCPVTTVEAVLECLQQFDPPGVFARSLKECLALQLREANRLDPAMAALLDHLELMVAADLGALARACKVLEEDLPEMIAEIKALYPKPGLAYASEPVAAIVPDIFVQLASGAWRVELNSATLPRVLVNHSYYLELSGQATDKPAKAYLSERLQTANWLVKALDQRARTLLKVAEAVVAHQLPFLNHGVHRLRPLLLRDIAEATELHESTVSRATADKYVATPRGNFPFRYFFSNALPGVGGGASHAAEAIRQQIKAMIDREEPMNVLSDDQIVAALRRLGVAIARRTVAKYRDSLAIPSSVQRRRAKALGLA
ncbi:MAG: RNA polymerase factor sigma-54 [Geminicoccaceae bacterium]